MAIQVSGAIQVCLQSAIETVENLKEQNIGLIQNGYSEKNPLKVKLSYNDQQINERVANAVRSHWAMIFVETEFVAQPSKAHFKGLLDGDYEIGRVGWYAAYV